MPIARIANQVSIDLLEGRQHFDVSASFFPYTLGGPGFDSVQRVVPNADGAIVAGLFSGTVDFDTGSGTSLLTARGDTDAFVASYSTSGALNWVKQIGGNHTDRAMTEFDKRDILTNPLRINHFVGQVGAQPRQAGEYVQDLAVDASGNVTVVGAFKKTIQLDAVSIAADTSIDDDFYDALIAKYDASGNLLWARNVGGPFDDVAMSVGLDSAGNPYVGGYYTRQADFDPSSAVRLITSEGRDAGFVMRLTTDGALAWVYQFAGDEADARIRNAVNDIAVTGSGNVYFVGSFGGDVDFNPSAANYVLRGQGRTDAIIGSVSRKGAFNWAIKTGGDKEDSFSSVAFDSSGNVYAAGYFTDEVDVDPRARVTRTFTATPEPNKSNPTFSDILISKFALDGMPVWQAQMGGGYIETVNDLKIGEDGSVYTVGSFFQTADFAPGSSEVLLSSATVNTDSIKDANTSFGRDDTYDWYVSRLSPRGKYVNAARFGGQDDDYVASIAVSGDNLYVAGRATTARGTDRDTRNEQSLVLLLDENLSRVSLV